MAGQGVTLGTSRKTVGKSKFRIEIDGVDGELRPQSVGKMKINFSWVKTEEGGAPTTTSVTINGYTYDTLVISRPLSDDASLVSWIRSLKAGVNDLRNATLYALDSTGKDLWKWPLYDVGVLDYEDMDGDAKAKEDAMMETITLSYRERGERELVQ